MDISIKQKLIHTAPRKLRQVGNLVRSWPIEKAIDQLKFIPKSAAQDLRKALLSALAAAKSSNMNIDNVYIQELRIDEGPRLKRRILGSRGRAYHFNKQLSHIFVKLSEKDNNNTLMKEIKKPESSKVKEKNYGSKS